MSDWHTETDELVGLALGELGSAEAEQVTTHLGGCAACRDEYAEISDGVEQALVATPAIAPPAGFSGRVLAAMTAERPGAAQVVPLAGRIGRRTVFLAAAASLVVGVGGTLGATSWLNRPRTKSPVVPTAAVLLTAKGDAVGSAGLATLNGTAYLLINITSGRPGASYECILVGPDGRRTSGGSWTLTDEYGTGQASGSWLVPITGDQPASVQLVTASGNVWSQCTL